MFALFSATFMIFVTFRSISLNESANLAYCLLNLSWAAYYLFFLILSIYLASAATKEVEIL